MAKKAKELSALAVSKLRDEGRYAVGGVDGLYLRIAGNSRAWVLRIKIGGKRCDVGLGAFPEITLSAARDLSRDHRRKVREGVDPLAERREARAALLVERAAAKTFKECAEAYVEANKAGWKNDMQSKEFDLSRSSDFILRANLEWLQGQAKEKDGMAKIREAAKSDKAVARLIFNLGSHLLGIAPEAHKSLWEHCVSHHAPRSLGLLELHKQMMIAAGKCRDTIGKVDRNFYSRIILAQAGTRVEV